MTFEDFKLCLRNDDPPREISAPLKALWYDAQGNWHQAHLIAQEINDYAGAWVHGYLHRKEGDLSNASYWYSRAAKKMPNVSLDEEWEEIAKQLLKHY
jgi:hypothetical protein